MNDHFKATYLYIKTHNTTGLKYFGKTNQRNPYKYKGSGKRWTNHIKKHGNDVTTEIVGIFTDKIWCMFYALEFSEINAIVASDEWANLIEESGIQGGFNGENFDMKSHLKGRETRRLAKSGIDFNPELQKLGQKKATEMKVGYMNPDNYNKGITNSLTPKSIEKRKATYKQIGHSKGSKNSQYGKCWIYHTMIGNRRINPDLIEEYISQGWCKGVKRYLW
jgi:hypothetical protein